MMMALAIFLGYLQATSKIDVIFIIQFIESRVVYWKSKKTETKNPHRTVIILSNLQHKKGRG